MKNVHQQLDTLIVTQPVADPNRFDVRQVVEAPMSDMPLAAVMDARQGLAVTCVDVGSHGVAYAEEAGRIHVHTTLSLLCNGKDTLSQRPVPRQQTFWAASLVTALAVAESQALCGDQDGRLLSFICDDGKTNPEPELLVTASRPWLAILSTDEDGWLAINADGSWALLGPDGSIRSQGKLPMRAGQVDEAHYCPEHQTLFYRVASADTSTNNASSTQWQAWSLADDQPLPLPDVIRFAPTLTATSAAVFGFNTQGGSWLGVPSGTGLEVQPLNGWPAGPDACVIPLDHRPVVMHLDLHGTLQAFDLRKNTWQRLELALPSQPVAAVWVARPGTWTSAHAHHQEREAVALAQESLNAHLEHREDERDALIAKLDQTPHGAVRADLLRARIAEEEGRRLDVAEELARAIMHATGKPQFAIQRRLVKTLWHIGGFSQQSILASILSSDACSVPGFLDGIDRVISDPSTRYFIDAFAPQPPKDCDWSNLAWPALQRWGSPSPCWIGAEHEPPIELLHGDHQLLPDIMKACGASPASIHVLTPDGVLRECDAWVFSEPISHTTQRQLLAYVPRPQKCPRPNASRAFSMDWSSGGRRLLLCWAIRAEGFLPPTAWRDAWEAVHDHAWREAHEHRIEVIHQALAHRIVPGDEVLGQIDAVAVNIQEEAAR